MAKIDDVIPTKADLGLAAYSKQAYDSPSYQAKIKHAEKQVERRERTEEKETERIEKAKEKESDRWFAAKMLIIGALIGALITKALDLIFK